MFDKLKKFLTEPSEAAKGVSRTVKRLRNEREETAREKQRRLMKEKKDKKGY